MSGISQSSAILSARNALEAAIRTALADETEVDITGGFRWPFRFPDWVAMTTMNADSDPATIGPRRSQEERLVFHVSLGAWRPGHDEETENAARNRAFGLLTKIQDHIRMNDITLDGTVLWCIPGDVQSDGATTDGDAPLGRVIEIDASFECSHRIRTN